MTIQELYRAGLTNKDGALGLALSDPLPVGTVEVDGITVEVARVVHEADDGTPLAWVSCTNEMARIIVGKMS